MVTHNPDIPVFVPTDPTTWPEELTFNPGDPETWPPVNPPPNKTTTTQKPSVKKLKIPKQIARILGVPVSSPMVQETMEALYGGRSMGLVPGKKFDPNAFSAFLRGQDAKNKNKMARGGRVDNANDDFENILRMLQS